MPVEIQRAEEFDKRGDGDMAPPMGGNQADEDEGDEEPTAELFGLGEALVEDVTGEPHLRGRSGRKAEQAAVAARWRFRHIRVSGQDDRTQRCSDRAQSSSLNGSFGLYGQAETRVCL